MINVKMLKNIPQIIKVIHKVGFVKRSIILPSNGTLQIELPLSHINEPGKFKDFAIKKLTISDPIPIDPQINVGNFFFMSRF